MPRSQIAIAACSSTLGKPENGKLWVQVTPCGSFRAIDGRPENVDAWFIDANSAKAVIERFNARKNRTVIDYEHQTLNKEKNGEPAPAAAWIDELEWREGQGLYGLADLTKRASNYIDNKEYRYFSPVITYDNQGIIQDIVMGAFTNYAGIDGMQPLTTLTALAAEIFLPTTTPEDKTMDLTKILEALGLKPEATPDEILAAIKKLQDDTKKTSDDEAVAALSAKISQALGITSTNETDVIAACTALKTAATIKGNADPSKYVPVEAVAQMQQQMAALSAQVTGDKVEQLVTKAKTEGKLPEALVGWATDLGNKDFAALSAFIEKTPAIAALTAMQTGGKQSVTNALGLTDIELSIAALSGLTAEQFAKEKKEENR